MKGKGKEKKKKKEKKNMKFMKKHQEMNLKVQH